MNYIFLLPISYNYNSVGILYRYQIVDTHSIFYDWSTTSFSSFIIWTYVYNKINAVFS